MRTRNHNNGGRSGSILVIVLWIAFGLVTVALYFGQSMTYELRSADSRVAAMEAEQAINGAVRYLSYILAQQTNGMAPAPSTMQVEGVAVGEATYWVIGRNTNQSTPSEKVFFGLVDEASKLNLNIATSNMLMNLPNMTPELAAAITDWRRTSTEASVGGAKDETYSTLNPPYLCKNGKFETVEELHMVYGMNKELLFGEDVNLNGVMDANENDGDTSEPTDNRDGRLDPGYWEYFTVASYEPTNRVDGSGKININSTSTTELQTLLTERMSDRAAQVVAAVKARVNPTPTPSPGPGPATPATPRPFTSLMDVFTTVSAVGITADDFALIAQDIFVPPSGTGPVVSPVNINTANEIVLSCIPGIGITNAASVVAYRESNPSALTSVAWLVDAIGRTAATAAGRYITAYSYQFTADIAAVGHHNQGYRRVRFIFDLGDSFATQTTTPAPPRIMYRQDLTHLGWALGKQVRQNLLLAKDTQIQ